MKRLDTDLDGFHLWWNVVESVLLPVERCRTGLTESLFSFFFLRFLRNPVELKSIKNISLLRHQMAAAAAAANTTTTSSSTTSAPGKLADSTDASSERYSPSSSCNNAEDYGGGEPLTPSSGRNFIDNNNDNDCDMPTDLSMSNSVVPSIIKAEKIMPSAS